MQKLAKAPVPYCQCWQKLIKYCHSHESCQVIWYWSWNRWELTATATVTAAAQLQTRSYSIIFLVLGIPFPTPTVSGSVRVTVEVGIESCHAVVVRMHCISYLCIMLCNANFCNKCSRSSLCHFLAFPNFYENLNKCSKINMNISTVYFH